MIAVALIGSQAAAICTVIALSQCVRKRNENGNATSGAEQAAWAVACCALTVSLAAQISGGPAGLTSLEFRVTELGAGIALLALAVAAAGVAVARQRAGRYASSRPDIRAVTLAAGAAVVLAAGMAMIVSGSSGTRPGQAFQWLCLLGAALAAAASLVSQERVLVADSGRSYAGDGEMGGGAAPARRAWRASRDARDDWDRPLSGDDASANWDEEDDWDAPAGHGARADEGARVGQDSRATRDAPARRDPGAGWDPPIREHARAEAARADSGPPIHRDRPVAAARADWDASASKEPQASDEDASDWFRPAIKPARTSRDAPARRGALPEVTDEPDLVSLPELTALRDLVSLPDLDVMPDLAALLGGSVLDRIGSGRHAAGRAAEPTDADETRSPADQAASPGVTGFARGEDSAASEGSAAAGQQRVRPKQPYGRITVYRVLEQYVAAFDQLLGDVVDGVRAYEPDTLVYAVNKVPSVPLLRILFAVFRDKAAYRKHTESPYFRELNCAGRPLLEATNVIELGSRRDSSTLDSSAFS